MPIDRGYVHMFSVLFMVKIVRQAAESRGEAVNTLNRLLFESTQKVTAVFG